MGKERERERPGPSLYRYDGECYQMITQTPCYKPLFVQLHGLCHYMLVCHMCLCMSVVLIALSTCFPL